MLSDFALMILSDNRKKNYIRKNKNKLDEEQILRIINSSKKGITMFNPYELGDLNISSNAFLTLLSNIPSDTDKEKLYSFLNEANSANRYTIKINLSDCSGDVIVKFFNSIKEDEIKLKFISKVSENSNVFVEFLKTVDNKIDYIVKYSHNSLQLINNINMYQRKFNKLSDLEIFDILLKFVSQNKQIKVDKIFIEFINNNIISDEIKLKIIIEFNLYNDLSLDNLISLINNSNDYHNMQYILQILKNKYSDRFETILSKINNNELKEYLYKDLFFPEIISFLSASEDKKISLMILKSSFKDAINSNNFLVFMLTKLNDRNILVDSCLDLISNDELKIKTLIELLKKRNNLHSNIEVFLLLLDTERKNSVIYIDELLLLNEITDLDKYLTKDELELYLQKLFNEYEWNLILKMFTKEQIVNSFLSDLDKCLLLKYFELDDSISEKHFVNYIKKNRDKIEIKDINNIAELIMRISHSNSTEIQHMRDSIIPMLLETNDPFENLKYIEDIFIKNNLPMPAKLFLVFDKLHPNCSGFDFNGKISPTLKSKSVRGRQAVIFSDLLKASLGSNNRSIKEYLNNIYNGNILFKAINMNLRSIDELSMEENEVLTIFVSHLNTLYNNTLDSNLNGKRNLTGDLLQDIKELNALFTKNGEIQKDLPDRIVRMFGYLAGFDTYQEMITYMHEKCKSANLKNRNNSNEFRLEKGDFIKGIGDVKYLGQILQNGSVAKEYLGDCATSDATPLDTDLSQIQIDGTLTEMISSTIASGYGPIYFVLKNDDRFNITRTEEGEIPENIRNLSKLEIFYTGTNRDGHYGIRTGFASSDIDYILCNNYDKRIALEIAMNGFYIPIIDKNTGNLLFSPNDYDILRGKMMGLTHYDASNYQFSNNLENPLVNEMLTNITENEQEVNRKRNIIIQNIKTSLAELGLSVKTEIDGDITPGSVELIDTGSTGRKTNMPGDGDFDFIMRLDQNIIISGEKFNELKNKIQEGLSVGNEGTIGTGDFRLKNVNINGLDVPVDIDITFIAKTNKVSYSTDMCLKDRLETIRKQNPEKYPYVIANIQLAKKILKQFECYKPNRGDKPQGGLGGVGVENWILQNGGSFYDACIDFLEKSRNKTFEQFKEEYQIWDFGENHLAEKKGYYSHDNFVTNMSDDGYNKMKQALMTFVNDYTAMEEHNLSR